MNEFELACTFVICLNKQQYEQCKKIKDEVNKRIKNNTLDHNVMNGFRQYDPVTEKFYGDYDFSAFNGLFDNYKNNV